MMERELSAWLEANRRFYSERLADVPGPILECACGTGLILLELLRQGLDVYGFDASEAMLNALRNKAMDDDIDRRISKQRFESFSYDMLFDAIIIPTNSFSMLTTRDKQVAMLKQVRSQLAPGGRLLLDLHHWDRDALEADSGAGVGRWHEWRHPDGGVIRQRIISEPHDFETQVIRDRCEFEYGDDTESIHMEGCWLFHDQTEELLDIAGFKHFRREKRGENDYWIVYR
jgi:SAM-dependent methyltransferase